MVRGGVTESVEHGGEARVVVDEGEALVSAEDVTRVGEGGREEEEVPEEAEEKLKRLKLTPRLRVRLVILYNPARGSKVSEETERTRPVPPTAIIPNLEVRSPIWQLT